MKAVEFIDQLSKSLKELGVQFSFHIYPDGSIISIGVHDQIVSFVPDLVEQMAVSAEYVSVVCKTKSNVFIYKSYIAVML